MAELNLYQKIVEVRKVAGGFKKDTQGYGYNYVSGNQILEKIKDKMNELNLLLVPSTQQGEHEKHEYTNNKGQDKIDFIVKGDMTYTWINGDNPEETLVVNWAYYGQQDDISKAYGSGLTYSERYFLLKCLGLPTDEDDPDSKNTKDNRPQKPHNVSQGSKGGNNSGQNKKGSQQSYKCSQCDAEITQAVKAYSEKHYEKALCQPCQKEAKNG